VKSMDDVGEGGRFFATAPRQRSGSLFEEKVFHSESHSLSATFAFAHPKDEMEIVSF
jgi:hypothetical protein